MLTNKEKALLHMIPSKLGIAAAERRVIQRNVGGFHSAADRTATHEGFAAVMAFYEDRSGGCLDGYSPGFWCGRAEKALPTDRLLYRIARLAKSMGWTPGDVDLFLASDHMSSGGYASVQEAPTYWLTRLLEALKKISQRRGNKTGRSTHANV